MKKYQITLTEKQLRLIAECVEDCHRFMSGQMEMHNITSRLDNYHELYDKLYELKPLVTPELTHRGSSYGWNGGHCPNEHQRKFIAETYPIYREILHFFACQQTVNDWNVYRNETLTCEEGGEPIKIKEIKNTEEK